MDGSKSYGPFQPRWNWLVKNAWEPYVELARRGRALPQVQKAIEAGPQ